MQSQHNAREEWRDIKDYEGSYQASNHGYIRSLDRTVPHSRSGRLTLKGRRLRPGCNNNGYPLVSLARNGEGKSYLVSRLIAAAFHPEDHFKDAVVCHRDGNPLNNHAANLRWGTAVSNAADALEHGTRCWGERHGRSKLRAVDVHEIRRLLAVTDWTHKRIAAQFDITPVTVSNIKTGVSWSRLAPE